VAIGVQVGRIVWYVGERARLDALLATVSAQLEPDGPGTRFPALVGGVGAGELAADRAAEARAELAVVAAELGEIRDAFATDDGGKLVDKLDEALAYAADKGEPARIVATDL
jgi:hypothetical protein